MKDFMLAVLFIASILLPETFSQNRIPSASQIAVARRACIDLTDEDDGRLAGFTRLAFHDCVGGCDGCVDLSNSDNAGLAARVNVLEPAYQRNGISSTMSRADFWVLCAVESLKEAHENSNQDDDPFPLSMKFGRRDCASTPNQPSNNEFPSAIGDLNSVLTFFRNTFNLNTAESVALLGAHTLGEAKRRNSGFDGEWVNCEKCLDNVYYKDILDRDSNWIQVNVGSSTNPRWQWSQDGDKFMMLNIDICLAKNINPNARGRVSTTFNGTPRSPTFDRVRLYARDNARWLRDFASVFTKMVETTNANLVTVRGGAGGGNVRDSSSSAEETTKKRRSRKRKRRRRLRTSG